MRGLDAQSSDAPPLPSLPPRQRAVLNLRIRQIVGPGSVQPKPSDGDDAKVIFDLIRRLNDREIELELATTQLERMRDLVGGGDGEPLDFHEAAKQVWELLKNK